MPVSTRPQDFGAQHFGAQDFGAQDFFFARNILDGAFSLWEKRSMIDLPIRSYWTATNDRVSNKELRPPGICLGATWAGIFCYTEIADLWRLDFIYTGFADAWRLDFIYTEIADTNWSLGDSRGDDIAFVSSQMQAKFRRRFRVVFSWARIDRDAKM